jgi:hypothetical protein
MERLPRSPSRSFRVPLIALSGWMLVLPAIVFLSAVALRLAGGRGLLARTAWVVFEWTASHVTRLGAALLFVGLPGLVVILGGITLVHIWRAGSRHAPGRA